MHDEEEGKMRRKKMLIIVAFLMAAVSILFMTSESRLAFAAGRPEENQQRMLPAGRYEKLGSAEVKGRQGICTDGEYYWVSGSASLAKYDHDWNLIAENEDPFKGYEIEVNHIGDIDVFEGELYIGAEYFKDGEGKNIQIAVYDTDTLELKRTFPFEPKSGQLECSGIAVDPDTRTVWMCSWVGEESGRYLYQYDLDSSKYLGKVHMQMPPQWIQGIAWHDGCLYLTADDGTADDEEPDHLYRTQIEAGATSCTVILERTFDDVTRQGEIEGLTFDEKKGQLLVLYNRGARIVLGMPKGFYEGYDREISEVFTYAIGTAGEEVQEYTITRLESSNAAETGRDTEDPGSEIQDADTVADTRIDWGKIPVLSVGNVLWEPDCGIRASGQFCYDENNLYVHLQAAEENIRAENTEPLSPTYEDSCLEFFFMPGSGDRYFNFEINPNGCLYIGFGHGRQDSTTVWKEEMEEFFHIRSGRTEDGWEVYYQIPVEFIRVFYPDYEFSGFLRANVYKCGDKTQQKHYLSWNPVGTEKPDFHRPEYFGKMVFGK